MTMRFYASLRLSPSKSRLCVPKGHRRRPRQGAKRRLIPPRRDKDQLRNGPSSSKPAIKQRLVACGQPLVLATCERTRYAQASLNPCCALPRRGHPDSGRCAERALDLLGLRKKSEWVLVAGETGDHQWRHHDAGSAVHSRGSVRRFRSRGRSEPTVPRLKALPSR